MNLKKYTIVLGSVFVLLTGTVIYGIACGGWVDPYDDHITFYNNHIAGDPDYKPFYYIAYETLYDYSEPHDPYNQNIAEWKKYLGVESMPDSAVYRAIYTNNSESFELIKNKKETEWPDSLRKNVFVVELAKKKNADALTYLSFAKACEPYVNTQYSEWEPVKPDANSMYALIKEGIQQVAKIKKDKFLKLRYGYQICRLAHYSGDSEGCIQYFDTYVTPNQSQSSVYYWTLALKAGALRVIGKYPESAYLFSRVFSECNNNRIIAYQNVGYLSVYNKYNYKQALPLCKNSTEKADLLAVETLGNSGHALPEMKEIYEYDAKAKCQDVLLVREISKLEASYLSPKLMQSNKKDSLLLKATSAAEPNYLEVEGKYADSLFRFCELVSSERKVNEPALWKISGAYLKFMQRDLKSAKAILTQAESMKMSPKVKDQFEVLRLLITINEQDKIDATFEEKIFPSLQWLDKKRKAELDQKTNDLFSDVPFAKINRYLMLTILAPKYEKQNDRVKATLCYLQSEMISEPGIKKAEEENAYAWQLPVAIDYLRNAMNAADIEKLMQLNAKANKTGFEQLMTTTFSVLGSNFMNELQGTAYLREHQFAKAITAFKKLPANYFEKDPYKTYLAANSFVDLINDTHAPTERDTKKFTKLTFAQTMLAFEKKAKDDPKNAAFCYYQMANGFYNMSYNGNSWLLVNYSWSVTDRDYLTADLPYLKDYFYNYTAEKYYMKAQKLSVDQNFKAKCSFMAAKCFSSRIMYPTVPDNADNWMERNNRAAERYYELLITNKYFADLKKNYSTTPFYAKAVSECSYLKDFVSRR
ncbi:hypothetical protein C3K47_13795 [Solitalea longa]|uniref:Uncharacterized protein n=1 Tax=Solitalea longa TaxID=2079460 RepID=A0A2S4ZZP9_9SPHI|nr:hypothetical protein [Solitalea longa]POY35820.1 hypothetical protein C3K47_13795 [Solitalea longa]